jgi:redox-sensitive bicupin YhaK (pirin superfamily)
MLWKEDIPVYQHRDEKGFATMIDVIAGEVGGAMAPSPAPDSWAANPQNEVAIWTIKMEANASFQLPKASEGINRRLYFYKGGAMKVASKDVPNYHAARLQANLEVLLENGSEDSYLLLLQGRPIGEPVVQHGPFVMNTAQEIQNTMNVYQATQFGGWPWPSYDHVHAREEGRFAKFADGTIIKK